MGQSNSPPSVVAVNKKTNETLVVDELIKNTVINKMKNPKMVPINVFNSHLCSTDSVDKCKVYNEANCSIYERELPDELFIHILGFLSNREIIQLGRVCKNFAYYWIENNSLWNGRSLGEDDFEPFMYFKPISETPVRTNVYYYNHFLPMIINSFKRNSQAKEKFKVFKMVLLGSEKCGKSTLLNRLINPNREFDQNYTQTIGVEFGMISYDFNNNQFVKMQLWDCSGSPRFSSMLKAYTRGANSLIYCFDLSSELSFIIMKELIKAYKNENCSLDMSLNEHLQCEKKNVIIIGLKRELERKVSMTQIDEYLSELVPCSKDGILMKHLKVLYFELSSKIDSIQKLVFPFFYGILLGEESSLMSPEQGQPLTNFIPVK